MKIVCDNINEYRKTHKCSILLVSHHANILKMLDVSDVHIMANGKIVKSGDLSLALEIENNGYSAYSKANEVSEVLINE